MVDAAWVIARRDYVATVFSRIFISFLIGPLLILGVVGLITVMSSGGGSGEPAGSPRVALALPAAQGQALTAARDALAFRMGPDALPQLVPQTLPYPSADALVRQQRYAAVLGGTLDRPTLTVASGSGREMTDEVGLLLDTARSRLALGHATPAAVAIERREVALPRQIDHGDRADLARSAEVALFFFILLLAGMLLSNFIEEKSNKVIEVLAAAVPVDAIFLGKLAGMLSISVTAIAIWGVAGGIGVAFVPGLLPGLATPAVGWPAFCLLGILYFMMIYLLIGAVFLGIGSQAGSPREVQMLSMPVTMGQTLLLSFALAGVAHPGGWVAYAAAIFPWSSPLAMLGRAAELPVLWPHLLALGWQGLWLMLALRFAARRFRSAVLKSGSGRRKR